jgi:DNA-directed RNA polymerase specialized sigma24 family protein
MSIPIEPADGARHRARGLSEAASDRILALAPHLKPSERALIEQVYAQGLPVSEVARAAGVSRKQLNRRLSRILRRIRQPRFRFVATRRELLPRQVAAVARHAVLEGRTLRETAALTGQSLHRVRQHMQTIDNYQRLVGQQSSG